MVYDNMRVAVRKFVGLHEKEPTEASEMLHFQETPQSGLFAGFLMDTIATADKPTRYGKNNKFTYSQQPTVIGQGSERTINIFCAVPDAA
jgi:hypothetical protein